MANNKSGAQRYNDRMDKVFSETVSKRDEYTSKKKELAQKKNAGGKYATKPCAYHGNKNCSRCN